MFLTVVPKAQATTAFTRQTGEPCTACHMQAYGPWLTQYGQKFKLDGYVAGHANTLPDVLNPFAIEVNGSVTNLQKNVPAGQFYDNSSGHSNTNNNVVNDWNAVYYTGRIAEKVGSYLQLNINPQVGNTVSLAMADIRYANHANISGNALTYGVSVSNAPTMSDFWMTTYAWMYPYTQSPVALRPVAQPYMQALMAGANTAGSTAYMMINNHLYLEAGAFTSQSRNMARALGVSPAAADNGLIDGGAPYWRAFLQHVSGPHTMMIGTYGLSANVYPQYQRNFGTDHYVEYNADANYSFMLDDENMFMAMFKYTRNESSMNASYGLGNSSNPHNHLNSLMLMGMWTYRQTYNLNIGWMNMTGSVDPTLYQSGNALIGSANGSPNSNYFLFQTDYVPFGKTAFTGTDPYLNLRLSVQYWAYTQFNGASKNYDGFGRSAEANNTLYFVGNMMF